MWDHKEISEFNLTLRISSLKNAVIRIYTCCKTEEKYKFRNTEDKDKVLSCFHVEFACPSMPVQLYSIPCKYVRQGRLEDDKQ